MSPERFPLTLSKTPTTFFGAIVAALLIHLKWVSMPEMAIEIGLIRAIIPWVIVGIRNKPVCEQCGGRMKISKGFPNLVAVFESCGDVVDKALSSDYS